MTQSWDAASYERNAHFVPDLGADILGWLASQPHERVLDLGCGDGVLTAKIAASGASVLGVDISEGLLQAARARGLAVRHMNGQGLAFDAEFDAVFSNAALHWMTEPEKVVGGIRRALKPRGRFVAEFGGHGSLAAVITAMRSAAMAFDGDASLAGPWYYPTADEYRVLLEKSGFEIDRIILVPRPTPLPGRLEDWLLTFRKVFFNQFEAGRREAVLQYAVSLLRPTLCDKAGRWTADYVRLKVAARLV
jgi:SAM-dependent methyltransferase